MIQELNVNNFDQEINKDKPVVASGRKQPFLQGTGTGISGTASVSV